MAVQVVLSLSNAFSGASYAGNQMNHIALSPKYAGTMYGITNAASNLCGFLAPYAIGVIIQGRVCIFERGIIQPNLNYILLTLSYIVNIYDYLFSFTGNSGTVGYSLLFSSRNKYRH